MKEGGRMRRPSLFLGLYEIKVYTKYKIYRKIQIFMLE